MILNPNVGEMGVCILEMLTGVVAKFFVAYDIYPERCLADRYMEQL